MRSGELAKPLDGAQVQLWSRVARLDGWPTGEGQNRGGRRWIVGPWCAQDRGKRRGSTNSRRMRSSPHLSSACNWRTCILQRGALMGVGGRLTCMLLVRRRLGGTTARRCSLSWSSSERSWLETRALDAGWRPCSSRPRQRWLGWYLVLCDSRHSGPLPTNVV